MLHIYPNLQYVSIGVYDVDIKIEGLESLSDLKHLEFYPGFPAGVTKIEGLELLLTNTDNLIRYTNDIADIEIEYKGGHFYIKDTTMDTILGEVKVEMPSITPEDIDVENFNELYGSTTFGADIAMIAVGLLSDGVGYAVTASLAAISAISAFGDYFNQHKEATQTFVDNFWYCSG